MRGEVEAWMQITERHKWKEINACRVSLLSAHRYPHPRMSENGKTMKNSKGVFPRRHNLRRAVAENNVRAEKGLGCRVVQRAEMRRKRRKT